MAPQRDENFKVTREIGRHYGKLDLDRIGFFDDQPAGPFDKYSKAGGIARSDFKGRQLLAGQPNDYIDKTFKRIFDGEALQAVPRGRKNLEGDAGGRRMLPPSPTKLHSTPNDWFGCIGKAPAYFSPEVRINETGRRKKVKSDLGGEPPNFKIKPNPLGGPGYVDICLNPYPKHSSDLYDVQEKKGEKFGGSSTKFLTASAPLDYFPPNPYVDPKPGPTYVRPTSKRKFKSPSGNESGRFYVPFPKDPGGQHAGCFNKFPTHTSDPYRDQKIEVRAFASGGHKFLAGGPKARSKYTNSIINQVTGISCNIKNYCEYRERVYPLTH